MIRCYQLVDAKVRTGLTWPLHMDTAKAMLRPAGTYVFMCHQVVEKMPRLGGLRKAFDAPYTHSP